MIKKQHSPTTQFGSLLYADIVVIPTCRNLNVSFLIPFKALPCHALHL